MSKAWIVSPGRFYGYRAIEDWCTLIHADTRGKAIVRARELVDDETDFIYFHAIRFPEMEDRACTYQDCKYSGFEYDVDEDDDAEMVFVNDCRCEVCLFMFI